MIEQGERLALLGANGAGKTTTLDLMLGLRNPDSGSVVMNARSIGVTPQQTEMPPNVRVGELLHFVARHYHHEPVDEAMLHAFGIAQMRSRQAGGLSVGENRRVALALAFCGKPELVVLDEPTTALDLEARRAAWEFIRGYSRSGGTVVFTTHYVEEAEALASRIVVMNAGRIAAAGAPDEIRKRVSARCLSYRGEAFDPARFGIEAVVEQIDRQVRIRSIDTDGLLRAMIQNGIDFEGLCVSDSSLEDAVIALSSGKETP